MTGRHTGRLCQWDTDYAEGHSGTEFKIGKCRRKTWHTIGQVDRFKFESQSFAVIFNLHFSTYEFCEGLQFMTGANSDYIYQDSDPHITNPRSLGYMIWNKIPGNRLNLIYKTEPSYKNLRYLSQKVIQN